MDKQRQRIIGLKDKFGYMLGDVGSNMVLSLCSGYLLIFYTKAMGVSAAVVGTVMMAAKIVDAVTDMTMGRINDTWADKNGDRFRPWILYGSIPLVIASCSMYNYWLVDAAYIVKVIWLVVTYILFGSVFYTMVNIPYGAMSNVITPNAEERTSLSTWRMVGATIAGLVLGMSIPMIIYVKDAGGNSVVSGSRFFALAIVLGLVALVCLFLCYRLSTERVKGVINKDKSGAGLVGTLKIMRGCLTDRALLMNFISAVFVYAGSQIFTLYNQYVFLDYFGATSLSGIAALVMSLGMFVAAPLVGPLGKRLGKKELSVAGLALASAAYIAALLLRPTSPYVYMFILFITFLGLGVASMLSYSLMNDCIDNHYLETGEQVAGTAYGMNAFMRKLAAALCAGIGGWGLTLIGYDELAVVQTTAVRQNVFTLSTGIMTGCLVLCCISLILMPMSKSKVHEISRRMTEAMEKAEQPQKEEL